MHPMHLQLAPGPVRTLVDAMLPQRSSAEAVQLSMRAQSAPAAQPGANTPCIRAVEGTQTINAMALLGNQIPAGGQPPVQLAGPCNASDQSSCTIPLGEVQTTRGHQHTPPPSIVRPLRRQLSTGTNTLEPHLQASTGRDTPAMEGLHEQGSAGSSTPGRECLLGMKTIPRQDHSPGALSRPLPASRVWRASAPKASPLASNRPPWAGDGQQPVQKSQQLQQRPVEPETPQQQSPARVVDRVPEAGVAWNSPDRQWGLEMGALPVDDAHMPIWIL